jgi:hypothetical protein
MAGATPNSRSVLQHAFGNSQSGAVLVLNPSTGIVIPTLPQVPPNQLWGIYAMLVTVSAATTLTVQNHSGGITFSQAIQLAANGSIALDLMAGGDPWWQSSQPGDGCRFLMNPAVTLGFDVYWLPTI